MEGGLFAVAVLIYVGFFAWAFLSADRKGNSDMWMAWEDDDY